MQKDDFDSKTAVLLLAFGGPDSMEAVKPFLESVLAGRGVSNEQFERAKERYRLLGGKSPLLDITKRQARALENELSKEYKDLRVYVGMRHWHPFIKDTLAQIYSDGVEKVIAVSMAPQNSAASTGGYVKAVEDGLSDLKNAPEVQFVGSWHNNPEFMQILAKRIEQGLADFGVDSASVIFSAHSLPQKLVENDPYVSQLKETIEGVLKITGELDYALAYQSKGGGPDWLEPSVDSVLEELAQKGARNVLLVPFGFVSDHVETLYDIDIVYTKKAKSLGLNFKRTPSFNDSVDFINFLSTFIGENLCDCSPATECGDCHQPAENRQ